MGPGALVRRWSQHLDGLSVTERDAVLRALLALYPLQPLSAAERAHRYRASRQRDALPHTPS